MSEHESTPLSDGIPGPQRFQLYQSFEAHPMWYGEYSEPEDVLGDFEFLANLGYTPTVKDLECLDDEDPRYVEIKAKTEQILEKIRNRPPESGIIETGIQRLTHFRWPGKTTP
jgi:hypothetical protein